MAIILLNLLNGLAVSDTDAIQKNAEKLNLVLEQDWYKNWRMVHVFPEMDDTLCATHKRTAYIISEQAEPNQIHSTSNFTKRNQY